MGKGKTYEGQASGYTGYGGIEDLPLYVKARYGSGWMESKSSCIAGILSFTQNSLEQDANNCTLASITRVMNYYREAGYGQIPSDIHEIYKTVREIGVRHGYDPKKTGLFRDLFVYTPWEIGKMAEEAWYAFGYPEGKSRNAYLGRLKKIRSNMDRSDPMLLNIVSGDYPGHTVTVTGYKEYAKPGERPRTFVRIFDGWTETPRYIDWSRFLTLSNETVFTPPPK